MGAFSMSSITLEERVSALERQLSQLMRMSLRAPSEDAWKSTIGMFQDDPVMKEVQEEGRRIREADREQARRDYS
jgi:hypothetical protein